MQIYGAAMYRRLAVAQSPLNRTRCPEYSQAAFAGPSDRQRSDAVTEDPARFESDVSVHLNGLRVSEEARRRHRLELMPHTSRGQFLDGGSALFDLPRGTPSVWGTGSSVLWAKGEALIISGPPGVGKTTIAGQLVAGLVGVHDDVLGLPVTQCRRVLYIAADRPLQIRRAIRRCFDPEHRPVVEDRLTFWEGPPRTDFALQPTALVEMCEKVGADVVIIDSLKDVALGLAEDGVGARLNSAMQTALAADIQVLALHHHRKSQNGSVPKALPDVYGSTWITAGAGSVVSLWGDAGSSIVDLTHLKQPVSEVGPWRVVHNHQHGHSTVLTEFDVEQFLRQVGAPVSTKHVAAARVNKFPNDLTKSNIEGTRKTLESLVRQGVVGKTDGTKGGKNGGQESLYSLL